MQDRVSVPDVLLQVIVARYSAHVTAEQLAEIRRGLERAEQTARTLRQYALTPADEPLALFVPQRTERE